MRAAVAHRGPDDKGLYISPDKEVCLGHRRLAVIDTSARGHQPMLYLNRYCITFNGEIYNFEALRDRLRREGYAFSSRTDTEVILALYDQQKEKCVEHLRGMFAFAIYDEQEKILFAARDRAGQKPFKYFYDGQMFMFASELKAILTQKEYKAAPDFIAIHHYLTYQYVPAPRTGFANIHKLEPAHYLRLDIRKHHLEKHRYWQLDFTHKKSYSENEWQERITDKLEEATKLQMISDVPLGAFLSGGIDSSTIVGLMNRHAPGKVKTFSIGFREQDFNETSYARAVAKHFNTDHEEFIVEPHTVEILPQLVNDFEEPYADSSAIPTYYLSKLARSHVTVALNGDGGDENFAGYARYNFHKLALALDSLGISKIPGLPTLGSLLSRSVRSTLAMRAGRFFDSLPDNHMRRYVTYLCYFTNAMKDALYQPGFSRKVTGHNSYDLAAAAGQKGASASDQALSADIAMYLPEDLLAKVDIASMVSALEGRSPFLDHEFMELTAAIPEPLKLKGFGSNKYILKKAVARMLPAEVINRPKMGFILPIERWFREDMNSYLHSMLLAKNTRITQELFRKRAVANLVRRHERTKINLAPPLWALLTLELWLRQHFP